ncbi:MAG: hypothetical protein E7256_16470 [Lachnospiraceae bacterium]|nr:hypothetical protein [Lachnospiraceae bacterium]
MNKWKRFADKYAYSYFCTLMLSFGIMGLFLDYYEIPVKAYWYVLMLAVECIYIEAIGTNVKRGPLYGMAGIVLIGIVFYMSAGKAGFYNGIRSYGTWLLSVIHLEEIKEGWYGYLTVMAGGILIGTFAFFIQRYRLLHFAGIGICSAVPFLLLITHTQTGRLTLFGMMGYAFFGLVGIALKQRDTKRNLLAITHLLPVILMACLCLAVIPVREEPIDWSVFTKAAERVVQRAERLIMQIRIFADKDEADFGISFSGYSESGKIGGSIQENGDTILLVKTNRTKSPAAYLNGNMKNIYTEDGWEEEYEETQYLKSDQYTENQVDLWELLYGLYKTGRIEDYNTYFSLRELTITYEDIYTKSLFAPLKTTKISMAPPAYPYEYEQKGYMFTSLTEKGRMYRVQYMYLNLNSVYMEEFLRERKECEYGDENLTEEEVKKLRRTFSFLSEKAGKEIETILKEREEYIKRNYLSLPATLPERVKKLAENVTKDMNSDYEKMKALEQYVSCYAYTTTPEGTPKGQDVVDYFLFESLEGYCTYHASALAVLARCIGIPSRYVQGFCVPFEEDENLTTAATGTMAHAWCECYIKGAGWIPFEATPSYGEQRYQPWERKEGRPQVAGNEEEIEEEEEAQVTIITPVFEEMQEQEDYDDARIWHMAKGFGGTTLLIFAVWFLIRFTRYDRHYRKENTAGKYELTIAFWYHLLEQFGVGIEEGENFTCFMEKAKRYGSAEAAERLKQDYLRYRYDDGMVTEEMLANARKLQKQLRQLLLHQKGFFKGEIALIRIKLFINS